MKKIAFMSSTVFIILTFVGAGYVLCSNGKANAGYAVVKMFFEIASISTYRNKKQ